jgi:hypoxanthine phosphoribosyltransferase
MGDAVPLHDAAFVAEVLYSESAIKARVTELGAELAAFYKDSQETLVVLPVMSGAMFFAADLIRAIQPRIERMVVETIKARSYEGTESTGTVTLDANNSFPDVEGKDVLLVEDIVDTGGTLLKLLAKFCKARASSVRMVTLIDKTAGRDTDDGVNPNWSGFELDEHKFVVGYGLDFNGKYRELEYVGVLREEMYS